MPSKISRSDNKASGNARTTPKPSTTAAKPRAGQSAEAALDAAGAHLRDATLDVMWRQWAALGASAASHRRAHALVDPEALVLASLALLSEEPRLADVLHDWITRNADLLSVQRQKNLTRDYDEPLGGLIDDGLRWLAGIAIDEGKDLRWRSFLKPRSLGPSTWVAPVVRTNKSRASRARVAAPATLVLRFRLAFAVGVKADLLSYLVCAPDEWSTVRTIAATTGYTPAAVRRAGDDLAAAQFIESRGAQPAQYRIAHENWRPLLQFAEEPSSWRSWREVFVFATAFLAWHAAAAAAMRTPYVVGVEGGELLERHRALFERARIVTWGPHTRAQDWPDLTASAVDGLARWMRSHA